MKIASWNVNSLRMRFPQLMEWLKAAHPDVVCLQETKVTDEEFPAWELSVAGYESAFWGEAAYNGVAILSREPLADVKLGLAGEDEPVQRRLISGRLGGITIIDVYIPNGQSVGSDKYLYKLEWLDRLARQLEERHDPAEPLVLCGDFNIAPEDRDVYDPEGMRGSIMFSDEEHQALRRILDWGFVDTLRLHHQEGQLYSYWDYRTGAFRRNEGWRLDLILATGPLAPACTAAWIDLEPRRKDRPSDHTPVLAEFRPVELRPVDNPASAI